jgi:NADPH-dependent 2,4-dienoyl-CoA reductase/sulfur reductase-like enzyme
MLKLILVAFLGFYTEPLSAMVVSKATSLNKKPQLLVVGGGIGGISSAYDAKKIMSDLVDITVISDKEYFYFTPSNPWVAIGYRQPQDIRVSLTSVLPEHGIHFIHSRASHLNPEKNELKLQNGSTLKYDFLIVATGPRLAYEMVPGADLSHGLTHSICTTHHAQEAKVAIDKLVQDPGPVVVGALQGASCFGPAYEFAFLLHHELKKRGGQALVDQCPMTFVTSEPYTGHLGLKGAGKNKCSRLVIRYL